MCVGCKVSSDVELGNKRARGANLGDVAAGGLVPLNLRRAQAAVAADHNFGLGEELLDVRLCQHVREVLALADGWRTRGGLLGAGQR